MSMKNPNGYSIAAKLLLAALLAAVALYCCNLAYRDAQEKRQLRRLQIEWFTRQLAQ